MRDDTFTDEARVRWNSIPPHGQALLLNKVWCVHCSSITIITNFKGHMEGSSLVLRGRCITCRGKVARVIEGDEE